MKKIRYIIEAAALTIIIGIFRCLPVDRASGLGGWILRKIGPLLGASRKAERHMKLAFPDMSEKEIRGHVSNMWDNLGRVIAEYPHLETIAAKRITVQGRDILEQALGDGDGAIFCSAHLGNWEIFAAFLREDYGAALDLTYRALNNPYADQLLLKARTLNGKVKAFPKARESGRELIRTARGNGFLGILIDQKYNEGVAVNFFGMDAMTNPIAVELAQKTRSPMFMVRSHRKGGANFEIEMSKPLRLYDDQGNPRPAKDVLRDAHEILESWIRETPEQWLWLHRRWGREEGRDEP